jgi:hypothetical protein
MSNLLKEFQVVSINLLWAEPDQLIDLFKTMNDQDEDRFWDYSKQPLDLKTIYFPTPLRGGAHLPRFALWQPANISFGSAFVPNYGDEMIQLMRHLNRRFQIRYFSTHLSRNHKREGLCRFEHADEMGSERVVHVIHDGKWDSSSTEKHCLLKRPHIIKIERSRTV